MKFGLRDGIWFFCPAASASLSDHPAYSEKLRQSPISKRRAGICGWRAVFDVGFGERICFLSGGLAWLVAGA